MGLYDELYNTYQRAVSSEPSEQLPSPLKEALNNASKRSFQTNLTENYGTYIPRETITNVLPMRGASGYVTPFYRGNIAHISQDTPTLDIFAHEAAHVGQKKSLLDLFRPGTGSKLKGIEYPYYDPNNTYPPPDELLASLREKESEMLAGKRIWDKKRRDSEDKTPADYVMEGMKQKHPEMSKEAIKRYVDRAMFPEHQVMHETPSDATTGQVRFKPKSEMTGIELLYDWAKKYMSK